MTDELKKAKQLLQSGDNTCVVLKDQKAYTSKEKGIKPLMDFLKQDESFFENAVIADKVIGKAAALLMIYGGATEVFAQNISDLSIECFEKHNVKYFYQTRSPFIINRTKTGMCPMERLCVSTSDPAKAYRLLKEFTSQKP